MSAREGRLHAAHKVALVTDEPGPRYTVASPAPGLFRPSVHAGELVDAQRRGITSGVPVGELEILGKSYQLLLARGAGMVELSPRLVGRARIPVSAGETLLVLDGAAALPGASNALDEDTEAASVGLLLRAPSSGRFYLRPAPQKPAFVTVGAILERGNTVCLLEVMKTFHRVTYDDPTLPERARVLAILAQEEGDVTAGTPLFEVEPA